MAETTMDMQVREFQAGDRIRTGAGPATVESVKVGRVWAVIQLVGERAPMRLQVDETWRVTRTLPTHTVLAPEAYRSAR